MHTSNSVPHVDSPLTLLFLYAFVQMQYISGLNLSQGLCCFCSVKRHVLQIRNYCLIGLTGFAVFPFCNNTDFYSKSSISLWHIFSNVIFPTIFASHLNMFSEDKKQYFHCSIVVSLNKCSCSILCKTKLKNKQIKTS